MNSYSPASPYENPGNPKNDYDSQQALKLLADAGWSSRDNQGRLVKNGEPLQIELLYDNKANEPELTIYQEDLRKVGINLNLRLITFETKVQIMGNRSFSNGEYEMDWVAVPQSRNRMAIVSCRVRDNNNNITAFKNARVDQLCAAYDKMFDVKERVRAMQEVDGILANSYQYALQWYAPFTRIAYWNKFGTPRHLVPYE